LTKQKRTTTTKTVPAAKSATAGHEAKSKALNSTLAYVTLPTCEDCDVKVEVARPLTERFSCPYLVPKESGGDQRTKARATRNMAAARAAAAR
jgi:hypothetical protein